MTTRHVSAQVDYPFIPDDYTPAGIVDGIRDLVFVFVGDGDGTAPPASDGVHLVSYAAGVASTVFTFKAGQGTHVWDATFEVPHTGDLGQVEGVLSGESRALMIFDTQDIVKVGSGAVADAVVEHSRAQFYPELVTSLKLYNISRCNGVEDEASLELVVSYSPAGPVAFIDGHNCVVSYNSDVLSFFGAPGVGAGTMAGYGDTCEGESLSSASSEEGTVFTVNGNKPVAGNIDLTVSPKLGLQTMEGSIVITARVDPTGSSSSSES